MSEAAGADAGALLSASAIDPLKTGASGIVARETVPVDCGEGSLVGRSDMSEGDGAQCIKLASSGGVSRASGYNGALPNDLKDGSRSC